MSKIQVLFSLLLLVLCVNTESIIKPKTKRVSFYEKVAYNIIDYLHLKELLTAEQHASANKDNPENRYCSNMNEIEEYFFKVYSSSGNKTLTRDDLEVLFLYQYKKGQKENDVDHKTKQYRCKRKDVWLNFCF